MKLRFFFPQIPDLFPLRFKYSPQKNYTILIWQFYSFFILNVALTLHPYPAAKDDSGCFFVFSRGNVRLLCQQCCSVWKSCFVSSVTLF